MLHLKFAELTDFDVVFNLVKEAWQHSSVNEPFDKKRSEKVIEGYLSAEKKDAITILAYRDEKPVGIISGFKYQSFISLCEIAQESVWYARKDPKAALLLFHAFEEWADRTGCDKVVLGHHEGLSTDALKAFYWKRGYRPFESLYQKRIR